MRFQLSLTSIVVPKGTDKVVIAFIARGRRPPDPASPRRSAARPRPTARATPADPPRVAPPHPPRTEPLGQPLVGIAATPRVVSHGLCKVHLNLTDSLVGIAARHVSFAASCPLAAEAPG